MTSASAQRPRALDLLKARGMLRLKDSWPKALDRRRSPVSYGSRRSCVPARGLYQLPDAQVEAAHALAEAAVLVPKASSGLISALQFHMS